MITAFLSIRPHGVFLVAATLKLPDFLDKSEVKVAIPLILCSRLRFVLSIGSILFAFPMISTMTSLFFMRSPSFLKNFSFKPWFIRASSSRPAMIPFSFDIITVLIRLFIWELVISPFLRSFLNKNDKIPLTKFLYSLFLTLSSSFLFQNSKTNLSLGSIFRNCQHPVYCFSCISYYIIRQSNFVLFCNQRSGN